MGGNRKHGFLRGNANGRHRASWQNDWLCHGCQKMHGWQVDRVGLDGQDYCNRQYFQLKNKMLPMAATKLMSKTPDANLRAEIGRRIKARREAIKFSQSMLSRRAQELGPGSYPQQQIADAESGRGGISLETLVVLALALDTTPGKLLDGVKLTKPQKTI